MPRCSRACQNSQIPCREARAFTLVELLVVVSIIALLISILLPSLKSAREQAKSIKCQTNQKGIMTAARMYTTEENDWLPGSPGTTGSRLLGLPAGTIPSTTALHVPGNLVQTWDWAGPLGSVQMGMSLSGNRAERYKQLVEGPFECPSNNYQATVFPVNAPAEFKPLRMVSYNTIRHFMLWGGTTSEAPFGSLTNWTSQNGGGGSTEFPRNYVPKFDRAGQPSEKLFITDSSRFTDDVGQLTYNVSWNGGSGGAFGGQGATLQIIGPADNLLRSHNLINQSHKRWRFTYRHSRGKTPGHNVVFLDNHTEWMSESQSRVPDYWWPKNTLIHFADMNTPTRLKVINHLEGQFYRVRR